MSARKSLILTVAVGLFAGISVGLYEYQADHSVPQESNKQSTSSYEKTTIQFASKEFVVDVADEPTERTIGLANHNSIASNEGMLFIFNEAGMHCFWMKDVEFSIDIFWFDKNMQLVDSLRPLEPETYPESFCPKTPAQYVLELSPGAAVPSPGDLLQLN